MKYSISDVSSVLMKKRILILHQIINILGGGRFKNLKINKDIRLPEKNFREIPLYF